MPYFLSHSGPVQALDDEQDESLSSHSTHSFPLTGETGQGETTNLPL